MKLNKSTKAYLPWET
ncbi:UNVERIFIED_CONTAM: hypothetical protein GTU68_002586 [Idotea baltica]|nr:hypothetical protein [Idotea baltica]